MDLSKLHGSAIEPIDDSVIGTSIPTDLRLDRIQIGRGVACMAVVLFHTGGIAANMTGIAAAARPFGFGYIGVDFFFVLSGFILTWIHSADLGHGERLARYAIKRLVRVALPYWAIVVPLLAAMLVHPGLARPEYTTVFGLIGNILLLPSASGMALTVAWSLCFEIMFYAFFALLILSPRLGWSVGAVWLLMSLIWQGRGGSAERFLFSGYIVHFALGIGVATLAARRVQPHAYWLIATGSIVAIAAGYVFPGQPVIWLKWIIAVGCAAVVYGLASLDLTVPYRGITSVPLELGNASYAIYLVHYLALSVLFKVLGRHAAIANVWLLVALAGIFATLAGIAFHRIIERPLVAWGRHRLLPPHSG